MATPIPPFEEAEPTERHLQSVKSQDQLGMDEKVVDHPELEELLEKRLAKKVLLDVARKAYDVAAEEASVEIVELRMADDTAVRVGRFRITKRAIPARSVAFDAKASSRIQITLLGDD